MPPIVWSSWIADERGVIDYARVKSLSAVLLGGLGGFVALMGGVWEIFVGPLPSHDAIMISVGALVLPLTGGVVATGLSLRKNSTNGVNNA